MPCLTNSQILKMISQVESFSPDLAPSNFHTFYSLPNAMNDKNFSQFFQLLNYS